MLRFIAVDNFRVESGLQEKELMKSSNVQLLDLVIILSRDHFGQAPACVTSGYSMPVGNFNKYLR